MKFLRALAVPAALACLTLGAPAQADSWKNERGHGRGQWTQDYSRGGCTVERKGGRHGYREEIRCDRPHRHAGGPPHWAPAHGYRAKQASRHHAPHYVPSPRYVVLPAAGVGHCNRDLIGLVLGGTAGGIAGAQIGQGSGNTAAIITGVILGGLIGGEVGRGMDRTDVTCVGQALETVPAGRTVEWRNPDAGARYSVTPVETYQTAGGRYCREYQTTATVAGRVQQVYGTACRQPDGSWEIIG